MGSAVIHLNVLVSITEDLPEDEMVSMVLKQIQGAGHINDLPISFDIGWYEQKAVAVLRMTVQLLFVGLYLQKECGEIAVPGQS